MCSCYGFFLCIVTIVCGSGVYVFVYVCFQVCACACTEAEMDIVCPSLSFLCYFLRQALALNLGLTDWPSQVIGWALENPPITSPSSVGITDVHDHGQHLYRFGGAWTWVLMLVFRCLPIELSLHSIIVIFTAYLNTPITKILFHEGFPTVPAPTYRLCPSFIFHLLGISQIPRSTYLLMFLSYYLIKNIN